VVAEHWTVVVVPETHSDVFDGTKLIVQTLNSIGFWVN